MQNEFPIPSHLKGFLESDPSPEQVMDVYSTYDQRFNANFSQEPEGFITLHDAKALMPGLPDANVLEVLTQINGGKRPKKGKTRING